MKCNNCGTELRVNARFCHKCGTPAGTTKSMIAGPESTERGSNNAPLFANPMAMTDAEKVEILLRYQIAQSRLDILQDGTPEQVLVMEKGIRNPQYDLLKHSSVSKMNPDGSWGSSGTWIPAEYVRKGATHQSITEVKGTGWKQLSLFVLVLATVGGIASINMAQSIPGAVMCFIVAAISIGVLIACGLYKKKALRAAKAAWDQKQAEEDQEMDAYRKAVEEQKKEIPELIIAEKEELNTVESCAREISKRFPSKYNNAEDLFKLLAIFTDMRADSLKEAINVLLQDKQAEEALEIERERAEAEAEAQRRMADAAEEQARAQAKAAREQAEALRKAASDERERARKLADAQKAYESALNHQRQYAGVSYEGSEYDKARAKAEVDRTFAEMMKYK